MNKKISISLAVVVALVLIIGGVWYAEIRKASKTENAQKQAQQRISQQVQQQNQEKKQEFVVDVDMNVDNWQTRGETEAFTIKFPKEWHWMESSHSEREGYSRVITNNPDFDMVKYADIGIFTGGGYPPLVLTNDTEVVISFNGAATSDAGTPQDSIDAIFKLAKDNNPSVECSVTNNETIPFTAHCSATYDSQLQQSYYIINDKISLVFGARTTTDTLVKKEILDKMAKSIVLKEAF